MLEYTCQSLHRAFGVRPVSYRGGRWSLNGDSTKSLTNCGIRVDSTVTPGLNWEDPSNRLLSGPDFRNWPRDPCYLSAGSLEPSSHGEVLELPVGAAFLPDLRTALREDWIARAARRAQRIIGRPRGILWLRPTTYSRSDLRACLRSLSQDGIPVWVAMIHSSEIVPNHHLPSEEDVVRFRRRCITLVEDALKFGAEGATLREACDTSLKVRSNQ